MVNPEFEYEILIRESHLDTLGHVNNATYFQLLEEARWEVISNRGYGLLQVQELKKGPVILDAHIKFISELKLREKIKISTRCFPFEGKIAKIQQKMIRQNGEIACEALFTVGFFDLEERKLILPTVEWLRATGLTN